MYKSLFLVGVGGFIGSVLRFLISRYFQVHFATVFPWGTLAVNLLGCLLIGLIYGISEKMNFLSPEVRLFLTVGICGGLTTFSTFSNDAYLLLRQQEWMKVALFASVSVFFGIMAVYGGRLTIKYFFA